MNESIVASSQEGAVRERYAQAAQSREASLCCPVDYDPRFLKPIPNEVIERDYGCGDPSKYLNPGETVLDLGSGTGKICFIASQVVGPEGSVIGVDMTDDMLELARRSAPEVASNIGFANVEFRKGRIQDLKLDLEALDLELDGMSISNSNAVLDLEERMERLRREKPLIEDESIDVIVSNCVLNLVDADKKRAMFQELMRVLKKGGRAVISDIVSDREVTPEMMEDPELWSGCLSGALTEEAFLLAFVEAGFTGIQFRKFEVEPWRTVEGVVFRSVTVEAFKECGSGQDDQLQSILYNGPFKQITDDQGFTAQRGKRYCVGKGKVEQLRSSPYAGQFTVIDSDGDEAFVPVASAKVEPQNWGVAGSAKSSSSQVGCSEGDSCC